MYDITHLHSTGNFCEMMLMVPEPVWPEALLVHEHPGLVDMGDLRNPVHRHPGQCRNLINDDQSGMDSRRDFRHDPEA